MERPSGGITECAGIAATECGAFTETDKNCVLINERRYNP